MKSDCTKYVEIASGQEEERVWEAAAQEEQSTNGFSALAAALCAACAHATSCKGKLSFSVLEEPKELATTDEPETPTCSHLYNEPKVTVL